MCSMWGCGPLSARVACALERCSVERVICSLFLCVCMLKSIYSILVSLDFFARTLAPQRTGVACHRHRGVYGFKFIYVKMCFPVLKIIPKFIDSHTPHLATAERSPAMTHESGAVPLKTGIYSHRSHAHSDTHTHTRHRCDSTERTAHRTSAAQTPACTLHGNELSMDNCSAADQVSRPPLHHRAHTAAAHAPACLAPAATG